MMIGPGNGAPHGFTGQKAALDAAGPQGAAFGPVADARIKPQMASTPLVSKPPSDMQGQGRTAPDLNSPMANPQGLQAARLLGRRGSSF